MVFDKQNRRSVAAELDENIEAIRGHLRNDDDLLERYQDVLTALPDEWTAAEIREEFATTSHPGALPTPTFDEVDSLVQDHPESEQWESHEAVNNWARDVMLNVPMLAVDGSEIQPTTQFNIPVAYVQAAWGLNHHVPEGRLDRGLSGQLLAPEDVCRTSSDYRFVDSGLVGERRYEYEGEMVVDQMKSLAEGREAGEFDHPPIALYDGPLIVSFVEAFGESRRQHYLDTMSRMLATSERLEIPLVGYVAGTGARELTTALQELYPGEFRDEPTVEDGRVLSELMSPWGDRTIPFVSRRDESVDDLDCSYEGQQYDFSTDLLFSYLNAPPGSGLDRLEFPGWLTDREGPAEYETMYEYTAEMVRAEAAIGRGYPELLQQVDSDAVLDQQDRQQFLGLLQDWAAENDVPLEWDAKALSKELRRR
jgi:hypothetical protein